MVFLFYLHKERINSLLFQVIKKLDFVLPQRIEYLQVVLSIVSNSIQAFSKQADRLIKIVAYKTDENISVDIVDNAGGIPEAIINKIFNPYFTTKESSEGTGLGLFVSNKIISESMNGKIIVENIKDGAKFSIVTNTPVVK